MAWLAAALMGCSGGVELAEEALPAAPIQDASTDAPGGDVDGGADTADTDGANDVEADAAADAAASATTEGGAEGNAGGGAEGTDAHAAAPAAGETETFSIRWTGFVAPSSDGTYAFDSDAVLSGRPGLEARDCIATFDDFSARVVDASGR